MTNEILLIGAGFFAGVVDSIAGGGGLITLPVLSTLLTAGANAIGTNKIVGTSGALIAFLVYLRKEKCDLKKSFVFLGMIAFGSFLGSLCSPYLPIQYFRVLLILLCPFILWIVFNKKTFMAEASHSEHKGRSLVALAFVGGAAGFYDGFFGPGGGIFMLLGLLWGLKLRLFEALLLSKLANTVSASVSLVSYGLQGYVHVREGCIMAIGMIVGSFLGAKLASHKAEKIVRPILAFVVIVLVIVQIQSLLKS